MVRLGLCCLVVAFSTLVVVKGDGKAGDASRDDKKVPTDYSRKAATPAAYVPPSGHEVSTKECGPWPKEVRADGLFFNHPHCARLCRINLTPLLACHRFAVSCVVAIPSCRRFSAVSLSQAFCMILNKAPL